MSLENTRSYMWMSDNWESWRDLFNKKKDYNRLINKKEALLKKDSSVKKKRLKRDLSILRKENTLNEINLNKFYISFLKYTGRYMSRTEFDCNMSSFVYASLLFPDRGDRADNFTLLHKT